MPIVTSSAQTALFAIQQAEARLVSIILRFPSTIGKALNLSDQFLSFVRYKFLGNIAGCKQIHFQ